VAKKLFLVAIREVWVQPVYILASSHEEAIRLVEKGEGVTDQTHFEYSHTGGTDGAHEVENEDDIEYWTGVIGEAREAEADEEVSDG